MARISQLARHVSALPPRASAALLQPSRELGSLGRRRIGTLGPVRCPRALVLPSRPVSSRLFASKSRKAKEEGDEEARKRRMIAEEKIKDMDAIWARESVEQNNLRRDLLEQMHKPAGMRDGPALKAAIEALRKKKMEMNKMLGAMTAVKARLENEVREGGEAGATGDVAKEGDEEELSTDAKREARRRARMEIRIGRRMVRLEEMKQAARMGETEQGTRMEGTEQATTMAEKELLRDAKRARREAMKRNRLEQRIEDMMATLEETKQGTRMEATKRRTRMKGTEQAMTMAEKELLRDAKRARIEAERRNRLEKNIREIMAKSEEREQAAVSLRPGAPVKLTALEQYDRYMPEHLRGDFTATRIALQKRIRRLVVWDFFLLVMLALTFSYAIGTQLEKESRQKEEMEEMEKIEKMGEMGAWAGKEDSEADDPPRKRSVTTQPNKPSRRDGWMWTDKSQAPVVSKSASPSSPSVKAS